MSEAIRRLVALSKGANAAPVMTRGVEGVEYRFAGHMPDVVREAGFGDPALAYLRSADDDRPDEGFIDEADDTYLFYPLDPAHDLLGDVVAAHNAPSPRLSFPGVIAAMFGVGLIARSLLHPDEYDALRTGTGVALVIVAAALLLRRRSLPKVET